jgi:hypothetical protein
MREMRKNRFLYMIIALVLLATLASACRPNAQPAKTVQPEVITSETVAEDSEPQPTQLDDEGNELGLYGQPIDVPIMDANRDLQISRTGENISYKVDAVSLQDVMTYYQENLTAADWIPGPNENPVGSRNLVTLARTNEAKDRVTVTMQNNPIGEFVVVSIVIIRAP